MAVRAHVLLGGIVGMDGYLTSAGMFTLSGMLRGIPGVSVSTWTWSNWEACAEAIKQDPVGKIAVIGYSGGGSRATWLASSVSKIIDLVVAYDPSPTWQMKPLHANVKEAVCYHNTRPMMWVPGIGSLGGGQLTGIKNITTFNIAQQHLLVQTNQALHARTVSYVKGLT